MATPQTPPLPPVTYQVRLRNPESHPGQLQLCRSTKKRKIVRAGRRGGKTTGSGILSVEAFIGNLKLGIPPKRVLYAAPTLDQVTKFWAEVKRALAEPLSMGVYYKNESLKIISVGKDFKLEDLGKPGEARIRAKTAFNADTLRGDYADLLILDEYQLMDETAWEEVGAPMLIDNNGDVVFIYTPPSIESKSNSKAKDKRHAAKMFKLHEKDPDWLCVHFPSIMNPHISAEGIAEAAKNMTALAYRQEILALDNEEVPGALWNRKLIEDTRVELNAVPQMKRIVIGIDPSGSTTTEVGIVAVGQGEDDHLYVLQDASMLAPRPKAWAERSVSVYYELEADRLLGERNYGGDMVEETIRNVDESVSYKDVNASRGKTVRAEPVCALFEKHRMHIVGQMPELEEELCGYAPGDAKSPNRMDAMVWGGIELIGHGTLGMVDFFKSGRAEALMKKHTNSVDLAKVEKTKKAGIMTGDQTPTCPNCKATTGISVIAGGQLRCCQCAHQWWKDGKPNLTINYNRRIDLEK